MDALDGERGVSLDEHLSPLLRRWLFLDTDYKSVLVAFLITVIVFLLGIDIPW